MFALPAFRRQSFCRQPSGIFDAGSALPFHGARGRDGADWIHGLPLSRSACPTALAPEHSSQRGPPLFCAPAVEVRTQLRLLPLALLRVFFQS